MSRFILTEPLTIPAGAEMFASDDLGEGGLEYISDRGCVRVFIGRAAALREGMVKSLPDLRLVTNG